MSHPASVLSAAIAAALAVPALAQCQTEWLPTPPGAAFNNTVNVVVSYRGDLIAGGAFTAAGGRPMNHIARWDGKSWSALGEGLDNVATALLVHDQDLIVGGSFSHAGGQSVSQLARWDGRAWSPLEPDLGGWVYALASHAGNIVVGGFLITWPPPLTHHVVHWNGVMWEPLLTGGAEEPVVALASYGGDLFAAISAFAGPTVRIVRWDGRSWHPTGPLITGGLEWPASTMTTYGDRLVAAGGGLLVQQWDGSNWLPVGVGAPPGYALAVYRGDLIATLHPNAFPGAMAWNGLTWTNMPAGMLASFSTLAVHDHSLIAGSIAYPHWARWGCACYADCDNSSGLSVPDFGCFQTRFVIGDEYADCDENGAMTVAEFGCFQSKFVMDVREGWPAGGPTTRGG